MQKKLIALAVAGLVSGVAFAQESNVTVYGIADMGYAYFGGARNGAKSISAFDSGNWSTSRVGFKGSEDLGNGMKANFQLEQGLRLDTTALSGRKSWVGLSSASWGEVKLGSFGTLHDDLIGATNVMAGNSTAASPGKVYVLTSGQTATGDFHNAAAYYSPSFSGLQFKAAVSTQASGSEFEASGVNKNDRVFSAAVHYVNGPLIAGLAVERNKIQTTNTNNYNSGSAWNLAGMYDFKVVRVNAAYGVNSYSENAGGTVDKRKQWQVGLAVPTTATGYVAVNYARAKVSYLAAGVADDTLSMWGVGYFHGMSKRTSLYGAYGQINQNSGNEAAALASYGPTGATYEKAFQAGIRHTF